MDAQNLPHATWRNSCRSSGGGSGDCVEVAALTGGAIGVRDSKDPYGPALIFPASAWATFVTTVTTR
ncbi:DUF397 domain-containing protein [Micromonospora sp. NBC_01813]|uniref:DUF397 domain-containing protein n=1 Tax=Micromonospora sp. NBC_01813 TaxID=2975988 RepID=UPI002DD98136|nr:DUF397 domain-containing protein [Micromonospora sp. NBC_01813]WSA06192.1 DUF397 domain-containing protein [Micromonospora sp. NBC_01813]